MTPHLGRRTIFNVALASVLIASCSGDGLAPEVEDIAEPVAASTSASAATVVDEPVPVDATPDAKTVALLGILASQSSHRDFSAWTDAELIAVADRMCEFADASDSGADMASSFSEFGEAQGLHPEMAGNLLAAVHVSRYCATDMLRTTVREATEALSDPLFGMRTFCDASELSAEDTDRYGITAFYECRDDNIALHSLAETGSPRQRAMYTVWGVFGQCATLDEVSYLRGDLWVAPLKPEASTVGADYRADLAQGLDGVWNTVECKSFFDSLGGVNVGGAVMFDLSTLDGTYEELTALLNE